MAHKQRSALKAGSFIILGGAAALALVVGIKGLSHFTEPVQTRTVRFGLGDDIAGLRVGDEVRAGGFKIGEIRSISLVGVEDSVPAEPGIVITYSLPRRYPVRQGAKLLVQGTLTGTSWLNFESFGTGAAMAEADVLAGRPSAMHEVFATLEKIAPDARDAVAHARDALAEAKGAMADVRAKSVPALNGALASAQGLAADARGQVPIVVRKYQEVMDKAGDMMVKAGTFFGDSTTDFHATVTHLATATDKINAKLPSILESVDAGLKKVNATLDGAQTALADVKATVANARDMSGSIKAVLLGNQGKLDKMISSLKSAGDNLKYATSEIRRSPWRLLYKPNAGEMANLNLFDAAREFAEGAGSVNDASMALRDSLKNRDLSAADVQKLVDHLEQSMSQFKAVEQKLWVNVKE